MQRTTLSLHDYLGVFRRRYRLLAAFAAAVMVLGSLWSATRTPQYEADAEILVDFDLSAQVADPASQSRFVTDRARRLENELRFAQSREVDNEAEERLQREADPRIDAELDADIIVVRARNADPVRAAEEANTYASVYVELRASKNAQRFLDGIASIDAVLEDLRADLDRLASQPTTAEIETDRASLSEQIRTYEARRTALGLLADANADSSATVISSAEEPERPVSPQPVRDGALSLFIGVLLGAVLVLAVDLNDDRLRSKADLDAVTGDKPVLGLIPKRRAPERSPAEAGTDVPFEEAFRNLRTAVRFAGLRHPLHALQVTSANPSEGKTTTACHLSASLAAGGTPVVLIDGDLRNPTVHQRFGLPNEGGLAAVLLGQALEQSMFKVSATTPLWVMPAGVATENPADLLWPQDGGPAHGLRAVIDRLTASGVTVVLDSPPVLPVADALTLSRVVDGTLFVASAGATRSAAAERAIELLTQADARIVGAVLNRMDRSDERGYGKTYGYGYGSTPSAPTTPPSAAAPTSPGADIDLIDNVADSAVPKAGRAHPPQHETEQQLLHRLRDHLGLEGCDNRSVV